jgi:hypothetical protein
MFYLGHLSLSARQFPLRLPEMLIIAYTFPIELASEPFDFVSKEHTISEAALCLFQIRS